MAIDLRLALETTLLRAAPCPPPNLQQWCRLLPLLRVRRLATGGVLFAQGQHVDAFYAVLKGEVEARFTAIDGAVSVIERVTPPRLFGLAAFASRQASRYEALATRPSHVLVIGQSAYTILMDEAPGFARALMTHFADRYGGTLRLLAAARHGTASERLGLALEQLLVERGDNAAGTLVNMFVGGTASEMARPVIGWYKLKATQSELATLADVSRQTANLWLQQRVRDGTVRLTYGALWVPSRLTTLA
ncbi:Crp/Fnr family transcriptional regulator [Rhodoferax sp.]|uniref:Crp/Fnr family transcriptional regulator n=1 Tax=Rhodoferax sp. TaxID=50421 RepID=UPI0027592B46|nr:Crp/Fnr family transcriptional regulator [Rhodoferax sp.]